MENKEFYINTSIVTLLTILSIAFGEFDIIVITILAWIYYIAIHGLVLVPAISKSLESYTSKELR